MTTQLPADISEKIDVIADRGNALMDNQAFAEAEATFREGLGLLPEPLEQWSATLWFLSSIGDAQWYAGNHESGRDTWRDAILYGGLGNPFVHLRCGQTLFELGEQEEAAGELLRALLIAGAEIFEPEPEIYWQFVTSVMKPPDGLSTWDGFPGVDEDSPTNAWLMDPNQYGFFPKSE